MKIKPRKDQAIEAAIELTPRFAEYLKEFQQSKGQSFFKKEVASIQSNYGSYVLIYDDESKIGAAFMLSALGEEGVKQLKLEHEKLTPQEKQEWIESISEQHEVVQAYSSITLPETPEEWQAAKDLVAKLPEDERKEAEKRASFF